MKYLLVFAFVICINADVIKTDLTGEWHYEYSLADNDRLNLADDFILGTRLLIAKCDDSKTLKHMPPTVIEMRKKDTLFRNVSVKAFSKDWKIIDTFYPVVHGGYKKEIRFTAYGNRLKDDFSLDYSKYNTLAIANDRVYTLNDREYRSVKHIFIKQ